MTTTSSKFLYLAGSAANFINAATLSQSGSADSNFPLVNLQDEFGWRMFKYAAAGIDDVIIADLLTAKSTTFASVHFHNIDSGITAIQVRASTDNFGSSNDLIATMTNNSPTFFSTWDVVSYRYWALTFIGTNANPIYVAKWCLGSHATLTTMQLNGWDWMLEMPQVEGPTGVRVNQSDWEKRGVKLPFFYETEAERDEVHAMLSDSKWGEDPLVVVPDSQENIALYARAPNELGIGRLIGGSDNGLYEMDIRILEDQHLVITK